MSSEHLQVYDVRDKPTRWFHWINVLAVLGLVGLGLIMLNSKALGISGVGGADLIEFEIQ